MGWSGARWIETAHLTFWDNGDLLAWQCELPSRNAFGEFVLQGPSFKRGSKHGVPENDALRFVTWSAIDFRLNKISNEGWTDVRAALPDANVGNEGFSLWWGHPLPSKRIGNDPGGSLYDAFHDQNFRDQMATLGSRKRGWRHDYCPTFDLELTLSKSCGADFESARLGDAYIGEFGLRAAGARIELPKEVEEWVEDSIQAVADAQKVYIQARILGFTLLMGNHRERAGLPFRLLRYVTGLGVVHHQFCEPEVGSPIHGHADRSNFTAGSAQRLLAEHQRRTTAANSPAASALVVSQADTPVDETLVTPSAIADEPAAPPAQAPASAPQVVPVSDPEVPRPSDWKSPAAAEAEFVRELDRQLKGVDPAQVGLDVVRLVKTRVGQDKFRDALLCEFGCQCAVTEMTLEAILVASHIKPWSRCEESEFGERLDPNNGLLLSPLIDRLFDQGFLSFADNGQVLLSKALDKHVAVRASVSSSMRLPGNHLRSARLAYLRWHRENVFQWPQSGTGDGT
jgi:hypothetical protein